MKCQFKLINRDPNNLPTKARTTSAVTFLSISLLIIYSNYIGISRSLAAFQAVLAGFGTLVAYWATTAKEQDLQRVAYEIARLSDTRLAFKDIISVIGLHYLAIVMFLLYYALALSDHLN